MTDIDPSVYREVQRRRTFAIISHPDAGKTTLTEKLLLFGGCIEVAGAVRGRKSQKAATSDWLELEKQRGISVSSTVLTFEYDDVCVNLLDTPGHHDFSEDTYRTLMAADCAVMVLDLAKGIEAQTEKLFRVCALRQIPVITFVNKVDRPGIEPLELLGEIESKLGIEPIPQNWPIGFGPDFRGLVEIRSRRAFLFDDRDGDRRITGRETSLAGLTGEGVPPELATQAAEEVELLESVSQLDMQAFAAGKASPVFFGSALTNWGVEHFLRGFLALCPPPGNRNSDLGPIPAARSAFAGFVFKIQANLDPRHRDRVAFLRVCAGRFEREMEVLHPRTGKRLRLPRAHRVFGQDRETMDEAYPGDIIGLVNPGEFRLGDTLCVGAPFEYEPLPQFSPEMFAVLRCPDTSRRKQFERGLTQLLEEGAIQVFADPQRARREPILGAVGVLQLDVVKFRMESEYGAQTSVNWLPYKLARWVGDVPNGGKELRLAYGARLVQDQWGQPVVLFQSTWDANYAAGENPTARFSAIRIPPAPATSTGKKN
ncbi:peptide chain release factor 3 [Lignipirellula cremea]|uniref:Peptide chain release factor 3 n=1 Tax=Lignipirellula cremea TaxID=2528010 RepID=A0A518E4E5_9BACT|nr:peptide chain release factor 3 [Lignipirellula cremea]QDU98969.1 Peptide chain release factor 3 [Lignipirellula cremea]